MNTTEHLIACFIAECGDCIHAATKALRFGKDDTYPDANSATTTERLVDQINDLIGTIQKLVDAGILPKDWHSQALVMRKKEKLDKYMRYAVTVGALHPDAAVNVALGALRQIRTLNATGTNEEFFIADRALKICLGQKADAGELVSKRLTVCKGCGLQFPINTSRRCIHCGFVHDELPALQP